MQIPEEIIRHHISFIYAYYSKYIFIAKQSINIILTYIYQMKNCLFIIVFYSISSFAKAQSNFIKGIIINNNGDSILGTIDYRNWKNNPETIDFINASYEKKTYDPSSISGFHIPSVSETYTSFLVDINMEPGDPDDAINTRFDNIKPVKKKVFLLQIVKHISLSLYLYSDARKEHLFYVKQSNEPVELIHSYQYNESSKQVFENAKYKEQLSALFESCPNIVHATQTTKFRKREIQDIVLEYLRCSAPGSAINSKKKDPVLFKFGILAGVSLNKFKIQGSNSVLTDDNYSGNISPVAGISLDIIIPRSRSSWHIVNEIIYKSHKTGSSFSRPYGNGFTADLNVDIAFSYLQLNTLGRFVFPSNANLKPFINIGMGNGTIITENKNKLNVKYSFGTEENSNAIDGPRKYEFSMLFGAGVQIKKMQAELRYWSSKKSFSPSYDLDINAKSFQLMVNYQF